MRMSALIGVIVVAAMSLAGVESAFAQERRFISIGTGSTTGVYYAAGNAICRVLHDEGFTAREEGRPIVLRCASPATAGSKENLSQLAQGYLDFGIVQSDWHYHAVHGTEPDRVSLFPELRSVFSLYPEPLHLVVAADSAISGFADLKGKRVNIGILGSGYRETMLFLMRSYHMTLSDLGEATEFAAFEQSKALCDRRIDAFGFAVGVPNASVALATDGCRARIVPLDGPVERQIVADRPYYVEAIIPARSYRSVTADIPTFGVIATLVTRADVAEEVVYELSRAVLRGVSTLRLLHPAFSQLDPARMVKDGLTAPLHPGAARYYREQGLLGQTSALPSSDQRNVLR